MKNFIKILIISSLLILIISSYFIIYAKMIENDLSQNIIRLHVIANSDTELDQEIKLKVRDNILEFMRDNEFSNYDEAYKFMSNNLNLFTEIANSTLANSGMDYTAKCELDNFIFPMKEYENIHLPSGEYLGLRIILGTGTGHNWWCVMFPPLCFSNGNTSTMTQLQSEISNDTFELITSDIEYRFKIVDLINSSF